MPEPPRGGRERLAGLLLLAVAAVLLISSPTWFAGNRTGVGLAQVAVGLVVAAVGVVLLRRASRRR